VLKSVDTLLDGPPGSDVQVAGSKGMAGEGRGEHTGHGGRVQVGTHVQGVDTHDVHLEAEEPLPSELPALLVLLAAGLIQGVGTGQQVKEQRVQWWPQLCIEACWAAGWQVPQICWSWGLHCLMLLR
jgi:hypothetical protein